MKTLPFGFIGCLAVMVPFSVMGCGSNSAQMFGDPPAGQSLPSALDLDGDWVISTDAGGFVFGGCLRIDGGRPVAYFEGCTFADSLVTSKPIVFDAMGPVIQFTAFDRASGFALDITILATPRTNDFFDILVVADDAFSFVSIDGQMERL